MDGLIDWDLILETLRQMLNLAVVVAIAFVAVVAFMAVVAILVLTVAGMVA